MFFMYSGGAIMGLIDCFYEQNKINYYIHTHEQNLGHTATGYARSTGKPGICFNFRSRYNKYDYTNVECSK